MITKIKNSFIAKIISVVLAFATLSISTVSANNKVSLNSGTPIMLETISHLKSDMLMPGQAVDFRVKYDVKVGDKVVVPAGSIAKGVITRTKYAKGLGKPGHIEVRVDNVSAIDGQVIPLTGGNIYQEGQDRQSEAIILGVLICILFLTIKGTNAEVPVGTQINAVSAGTIFINVE